ncbi:hypothetical protein Q5H93_00795 [Hymenobacter sp. ASUV-10]|uniref:Lipocalin-like domain-containing protein n=1 Tax=Hymenobacter aranciens TaxID=3063996 RepID=A0ABT9B979_9BACT|nr:hypothetical protein [Hymenobacter sp. ASUV-10]MDO7873251.1 hypothetical protein [Hymenobacter sp. ASUV-10]
MKLRFSVSRAATLLLLGATSALTACEDVAENPAPNTKTQLLTADPWHITTYTRSTGGGTATNYLATAFPRSCERDDRYTFKTNGVQERTEGPAACGGGNSSTVVGTYPWNFNSSQTQLTLGGTTFELVQLTESSLQLRSTHTSSGVAIVETVTYAN